MIKHGQNTLSWFVSYWVIGKGTLLGGVKRSESSRFGEEIDARLRRQIALEENQAAGVECDGYIVPSHLPPEIFRHCDPTKPAQAVGGKCFGCGKVMTKEDAKAHIPVPLPKSQNSRGPLFNPEKP